MTIIALGALASLAQCIDRAAEVTRPMMPNPCHKEREMSETKLVEMDDNHWNTLQELLNAVGTLPGVAERIDAYMRGRGIEDPLAEIEALRSVAF